MTGNTTEQICRLFIYPPSFQMQGSRLMPSTSQLPGVVASTSGKTVTALAGSPNFALNAAPTADPVHRRTSRRVAIYSL
jgi:hypothetical protein